MERCSDAHLKALDKVHARVGITKHETPEVIQLSHTAGIGQLLCQLHWSLPVVPAARVKSQALQKPRLQSKHILYTLQYQYKDIITCQQIQ
jgi:hypothetical protein